MSKNFTIETFRHIHLYTHRLSYAFKEHVFKLVLLTNVCLYAHTLIYIYILTYVLKAYTHKNTCILYIYMHVYM